MMHRRRVLTWLPLAAAACMGHAASAPQRRLKAVTIGVAPYGIRTPEGGASGLLVELTEALAARSGIPIDNVVVPYPRAMAMMQSGEADLLMSIANSRLVSIARPVALVFEGDVVAVGRAGSHFASLADLRGKVVAHIRGVEYNAAFEADQQIRKHETTSIEQSLKMLLERRVDAAIGSRESLLYALRAMGRPRAQLGTPMPIGHLYVRLYLSSRVTDDAVADALTSAMDALRDGGTVAALRKKYFAGLPAR
ncbi:substrate-binding periplasmic protein [Duganella aceris]|uniref:Amino acid ABC transporter substrate-binding protein n=1 Tax=Duganella aceris TaxID=2703883 RepID=A0ABX0FRT6_9BURK|nr:transporter substrate-binding domain-containing protein [Duganella aceris]NGZ87363.1 amino acid ABC transporter substrate-binding protein [Duganella aceris]